MKRYSSKGNARVIFSQGEKNEEYIKHLYGLFKGFVNQELNYGKIGKDGVKGNKPRVQIKFATLSLPCLNYYYELFYQNKKKIIPKEIEGLLTYVSLSYWIMDDGSHTSSDGIRLSTEGYKEPELRLLVEAMRRRFEIYPSIHVKNKDKGQSVIYIKKGDTMRIRDKLRDHMHPSMLYKLGL